jgi:hypothetical protein
MLQFCARQALHLNQLSIKITLATWGIMYNELSLIAIQKKNLFAILLFDPSSLLRNHRGRPSPSLGSVHGGQK